MITATVSDIFFPDFNATAAMMPLAMMLFVIVGIMSGFVIVVMAASSKNLSKKKQIISSFLGLLLIVASVISSVIFINVSNDQEAVNDQIRENRDSFIHSCGVNLSDENKWNLDLPAYHPTENKQYGIVQGTLNNEVVDLSLAWKNDQLILSVDKHDGNGLVICSTIS